MLVLNSIYMLVNDESKNQLSYLGEACYIYFNFNRREIIGTLHLNKLNYNSVVLVIIWRS